MATKLDKTIKREIEMDGQAYMVAISPEGVKLAEARPERSDAHCLRTVRPRGRGTPPRTTRI
jgi:hypothetical protein